MSRARGISLMELLVAASMLTLFSGLVLGTLDTSRVLFSRSLEGARQRDILQVMQLVSTRARFSQLSSLSRSGQRTSTLTAYGAGRFQTDPATGRPLWQGYDVYLLEEGTLSLGHYPASFTAQPCPLELESVPDLSGRYLLSNVEDFSIEPHSDHWRLKLKVDGEELQRWIVPVN